jgi:VWFA-related protein
MKLGVAIVLVAACLALPASVPAQDPPASASEDAEPLDVGATGSAEVRIVLTDVVVVDRAGRTVPGLTADDFDVLSRSRPVGVDTLDLDCAGGAADDVAAVGRPDRRGPIATADGHKVVFLLDYLHLDRYQRERTLDQIRAMIGNGATGGDEVMLAALTGGLRIEQTFTEDRDEVARSLRRMGHDVTLWNGNYSHLNETGFVGGMTALFDVLGTVPGRKSVVMYSGMTDVPLLLQFETLAGDAAAARCALYPVDVRGLVAPDVGFGGRPELVPGGG